MPSFPALPEPLRDHRVALRYATERDIPEILIAHDDDPNLYVAVGRERPPTGAELGRRAENEPAERAAGTRARLTIVEPGSETFLGQLSVHHVEWEQSRAELGIWLTPQARGRGLSAGALRLVGAWLITTCGLERVQVRTDPGNAAVIAAARAAGYRFEGVLRSYQVLGGRRVNSASLSLVRADVRN